MEGHRIESKSGQSVTGKLCQPSSKLIPLSNPGKTNKQKKRNGFCLSNDVPRIQRISYATRLWETFILLFNIC